MASLQKAVKTMRSSETMLSAYRADVGAKSRFPRFGRAGRFLLYGEEGSHPRWMVLSVVAVALEAARGASEEDPAAEETTGVEGVCVKDM